MTEYHKTIPSAVLGEYLADVYRFEVAANTRSPEKRASVRAPCFEKGQGLGPSFGWLGEAGQQVADGYWLVLAHRARRSAILNPRPLSPFRRSVPQRVEAERAEAARVQAVKVEQPKPKRKPWQNARRHNEYKMREAILKVVRSHGWTDVGERKLGELADNMPHRTARTVLDRMAADGQVKLDRTKERGRRTGVYVLLDHPAWSDQKHAQLLAQSKLSSQVKG